MDWSVIIVAALSLVGTLFGSIAGIMTANKLTTYRISQLESKVDRHNTVIERVIVLEQNDKKHEADINRLFERARRYEASVSDDS